MLHVLHGHSAHLRPLPPFLFELQLEDSVKVLRDGAEASVVRTTAAWLRATMPGPPGLRNVDRESRNYSALAKAMIVTWVTQGDQAPVREGGGTAPNRSEAKSCVWGPATAMAMSPAKAASECAVAPRDIALAWSRHAKSPKPAGGQSGRATHLWVSRGSERVLVEHERSCRRKLRPDGELCHTRTRGVESNCVVDARDDVPDAERDGCAWHRTSAPNAQGGRSRK